MQSEEKNRAKVIAEFKSLFADEAVHLARYSKISARIKIGGIASLVIGGAIAASPVQWQTIAAAVFCTTGAFLAGLSVAYDTSLKSWPYIKPLLRPDAMEILLRESESEKRDG